MKRLGMLLATTLLAQPVLAAGDGPGNSKIQLAQACMQKDSMAVENLETLDYENSIKNLNFESEIFYQIYLNRAELVRANIGALSEYKKLQAASDEAFKKLQENPESQESKKESTDAVMKLVEYRKNVISTATGVANAYQELEQIRLSGNADQLASNYNVIKSYGDYMSKMVLNAYSCRQLHEDYRALAIDAKAKRNFHLNTISILHSLDMNDIAKETSKGLSELNELGKVMLSNSGYVKAAKDFKVKVRSDLSLILMTSFFSDAVNSVFDTKPTGETVLVLGDKNQSLAELEATAKKIMLTQRVEQFSGVKQALPQILK